MKKMIMFITCFFISMNITYAHKIEVKLDKCIDGDTARFLYNNESIKTRFLAINSPEIDTNEEYSLEAKNYTCTKLKKANKIILEYDNNSDKTDKFGRHLVWVWIDNTLLQRELISNGYAKVDYLYDDYKYTKLLLNDEKNAKNNYKGIWNKKTIVKKENKNNNESNYVFIIHIILISVIILIINNKKKFN